MSYSLDLPADAIASVQHAARDAAISAARTFGFGGSTWDVDRPLGGTTAARTLIDAGTLHALAFRQRPGALTIAGGGTPVLGDVWRLIVLGAEDALSGILRPGDRITSQADSDYIFTVASIEPWYDYFRCELERSR